MQNYEYSFTFIHCAFMILVLCKVITTIKETSKYCKHELQIIFNLLYFVTVIYLGKTTSASSFRNPHLGQLLR